MAIKLSKLLENIIPVKSRWDKDITGLSLDSRRVNLGYLFLACPGNKTDGRAYLDDAIANGAAAVVCEGQDFYAEAEMDRNGIPILNKVGLIDQIGEIAARFYDYPSKDLKMIGVTGTNGKTSCTHFIAEALQQVGEKCGIIGTLGNGLFSQLIPTYFTTPDAIQLQHTLFDLKNQGAGAVAMEVSSHGLSQGRVNSIQFNIAIFTNLTRDHLDYHQDMQAYGEAKRKLFLTPGLKFAVINKDDEFGKKLLASLPETVTGYAYGVGPNNENNKNLIWADNVKTTSKGICAQVKTPWGEGELISPLWGRFNLHNLLAVLTTLCILEIPLTKALELIKNLRRVPGRMEQFGGEDKPTVIVDYAHTPDALEQVLKALREHCQGKLWCVFGCGGDRDRGKRALMGQIAERYADFLVITDDNPRHEDPIRIVGDIMQGLSREHSAHIFEHDRRHAITWAIQRAKAGDVVLVAGKGHEDYQITGAMRMPFSDRKYVDEVLHAYAE